MTSSRRIQHSRFGRLRVRFERAFIRRWCVVDLKYRYVAYNGSYRKCCKFVDTLPGSLYAIVRCSKVGPYLDDYIWAWK